MDLLVPCAGKSSRFITQRPKYLLTMPDGRLMIEVIVEPFKEKFDRLLFAVLKEHDQKFDSKNVLQKIFPNSQVLIINELTKGQADTVLKMIEYFQVDKSFLVKDSDSYFKTPINYESAKNYISVCDARKAPLVKLHNKSFADISEQNYVIRTGEKEIMSKFFSCGGYFFSNPKDFIDNFKKYEEIQIGGEYFISNIIDMMIDSGIIFHPMECSNYEDWGTYEDWITYRKTKSTYFFDIDGVIYDNGSQYWEPKWGEAKIFEKAKEKINELFEKGNLIILVTSRPESFREVSIKQFEKDGLRFHQLIMNIFHGTRILINDYSDTNPYPAAKAINTKRNSVDFIEKLD